MNLHRWLHGWATHDVHPVASHSTLTFEGRETANMSNMRPTTDRPHQHHSFTTPATPFSPVSAHTVYRVGASTDRRPTYMQPL